jgi:type II secretory pathway pseudopilin PulG
MSKMTKMSNRRFFTLLELMIALMILTLIGALTSTQIKKLIDVHRFEQEVSTLFTTLQEAQILSATYRTDLSLDLTFSNNTLAYQITTDEPFTPFQLNQSPITLPHTARLQFNGKKATRLHFDIYSGGRIEPRGLLSLLQTTGEESKTLWIDLQHGSLLKLSHTKPPLSKTTVPLNPSQ